MTFDADDPRSKLDIRSQKAPAGGPFDPAEYVRYYALPPSETSAGAKTWYARGTNLIVAYTEAVSGAVLPRQEQIDEYAILAPDTESELHVTVGGTTSTVPGASLAFVPPGNSSISVRKPGRVIRLFTAGSRDLLERCLNFANFSCGHARVSPAVPWPMPKDGWRLRVYPLDVPPGQGRFGRIWRCTTLMVNCLDVFDGPRDPAKLSPHSHDDFEQYSLALSGAFIHHLRWPWTVNRRQWRDDEHEFCEAPSVAVIPPPSIHTTEACGDGANELVDIFCPPRRDFSEAGWVLNAADYPA